ncbi:MAG: NAD-dependent epimerase/dehydratase family protein, partial [Clostridiaceae bacterium]|nr:NAD-dependent epimerase/dehydratase family protein [Clostridiaceae bacterium]
MKRIYLITGATGHLGNTIVRMLLQQGESIRCLILEDEVPLFLQNLNLEIIHGDVIDKDSLIPFFSNLEGLDVYVLHLAGLISIASNIDDRIFKVNVEGTRNLLEFAEN